MRLIPLILVMILYTQLGLSQIYFSNQIYYNDQPQSANKIIEYDSTYLIVGNESESPFSNNLYFIEVDKFGNVIRQKSIDLGEAAAEILNVSDNGDDLYIQGILSIDVFTPDFHNQVYLAKINRTTLDTICMKNYGAANLHENHADAIRTQDGGFAATGWVFKDSFYRQRATLLKLDSLGNQDFYHHYTSDSTKTNFGVSVLQTEDKGYLILGLQRYWTTYDNFPRRVTDTYLIKTDSTGQQEWMTLYEADLSNQERIKQPKDLIPSGDGGYYICGYNKYFSLSDHQSYALYKVDANGAIIWEREYGFNQWTGFQAMINASNGNLVIAGYEQDKYYIENNRMYGIISSLTPEGDSLWLRKYAMSPDIIEIDLLKDILETSDGGFIATGDTAGPSLEDTTFQYVQNAWVIRVDSLGCLEPGCDMAPVATEEPTINDLDRVVQIYPNPVSDLLIIDVGADLILLGLQIYDGAGRRVEDIQFFRSSSFHKHEITLSSLPSGIYFVQVRTDEGWLSQSIVKM